MACCRQGRGSPAPSARIHLVLRPHPDGKVISRIVHGEIDGKPLSEKEIFGSVILLFIAGLDTVFATFNNVWATLARQPDLRQQIVADLGNINAQVEELLQVHSVTFSGRTVGQDTVLRGVQMRKGRHREPVASSPRHSHTTGRFSG